MNEGQYTMRFALNESFTIYHYNKWSNGRRIFRGKSYQDVKEELIPLSHDLKSYQIKSKFVEFTDCVNFALRPNDADFVDANIYCELSL